MSITVEATYENGVLKPTTPIPLKEREKVRLTIVSDSTIQARVDWVRRTSGIVPWTGDEQTLRRFASDPELDLQESP